MDHEWFTNYCESQRTQSSPDLEDRRSVGPETPCPLCPDSTLGLKSLDRYASKRHPLSTSIPRKLELRSDLPDRWRSFLPSLRYRTDPSLSVPYPDLRTLIGSSDPPGNSISHCGVKWTDGYLVHMKRRSVPTIPPN